MLKMSFHILGAIKLVTGKTKEKLCGSSFFTRWKNIDHKMKDTKGIENISFWLKKGGGVDVLICENLLS